MTQYAKVYYGCDDCGKYPVIVHEIAGEHKEPTCPECGSHNCHFEKTYAADAKGNITE